jgi:glycosyltransferase involved in cell wall biosynthesis
MTILFFSEISWEGLHQRPQHIVRALTKSWRVLWIEPATISQHSSGRPKELEQNLFAISIPSIPYYAKNRAIRLLAKNVSRVALFRSLIEYVQLRMLRRAVAEVAGEDTIVAIVHNYHLTGVIEKLKPSMVMYDYIDNAFGFTKMPKHVEELWRRMVRSATIVTATSHVLERQVARFRTGGIEYVGNGVEYDFFDHPPAGDRPADLPSGGPIIGYIGAVYPWLDFDLVEYACRAMPGAQFVFVGPVHPSVQTRIDRLRGLPNFRALGMKPYREVPRYLHAMDVAIIPFQRNELTEAVNPVKLYEYSAAGKPTVTTEFSDDLREYAEHIFIAKSREDFVTSLTSAAERARQAPFVLSIKSFAKHHDWNVKTARIIELIKRQGIS